MKMYYKEEEEEEEEADADAEAEAEDIPRKRRKGGDEDTDYRPPGGRRVSLFQFRFLCIHNFLPSLVIAGTPPGPSSIALHRHLAIQWSQSLQTKVVVYPPLRNFDSLLLI
jgi:hypothetical protein